MSIPACSRLVRSSDFVGRFSSYLGSPLLFIMRLYWGWQFFLTGKGKLTHIADVAAFFQSLHIPLPVVQAYVAGSLECGCGLLLIIGLASRLAALPLTVTLVVALATAHREALLNIFNDPTTFIAQEPFLFLLTVLLVLAFGPGFFSVDRWLSVRGDAMGASPR